MSCTSVAVKDFVTVVSVDGNCGGGAIRLPPATTVEDSFVTVLSIGEDPGSSTSTEEDVDDDRDVVAAAAVEEVLVYRLPGERLGFGLRFDGVNTCNRLFVQSCADGSPASRTHASWGPLSPGDEIVHINGRPVNKLSRDDCVRCLKESGLVVKLHMIDGRTIVKAPPPVPPRKQKKPEPAPPPIASSAVYTDAVERFVYHGESESDDTNSSVSTVVSKCPTSFVDDTADMKNNCVLDRVLEPFMQLEREFSSSAAIGDDVGLYEKLVAVAGEDRGLPPKPLPRKEVRPPKKKPPPPPPPPPPAYRLPPRLVDFVHKEELLQTSVAEAADAAGDDNAADDNDDDNDDVFANADSIFCPSADENAIAEHSAKEGDQESNATEDLPVNLISGHKPDHSYCGGSPKMKSSFSIVVESCKTDLETDSEGSKNATEVAVTATRIPTTIGRTDEVCNKSVRDKIAMFSQTTKINGEKKCSNSSSSSSTSSAYSSGSPESSPAASLKAEYGTLPHKPSQKNYYFSPTTYTPTMSRPSSTAEHRRSQSLVEQPYSKYFNTMNAYAEMGRSSLNTLIEQRRRSMSKLRGLVIPEKAGIDVNSGGNAVDQLHPSVIVDLPLLIKSPRPEDGDDDAVLCPPTKTYVNGPPPIIGTVTRYANPVKTVVRQPVATVTMAEEHLCPSPTVSAELQYPTSAIATEHRSPSSASSSPSSSSSSSSSSLNSSHEELRHIHDERPPSSAKSKSSFKADSDEDSALSSGRSSTLLQQYSPASSPPPPPPPSSQPPSLPLKSLLPQSNDVMVVAAAAIPNNGPLAAYDAGKRILKAESVEAINRKNVLCSARISSGKPEPLSPSLTNYNYGKTEFHHQHLDSAPLKSVKTVTTTFVAGTTSNINNSTNSSNRYTHNRMSSVESTTSDDLSMQYVSNGEPFGSISSLASSTSLISQQELQQLIDDANQTLEENSGCCGIVTAASLGPLSVEVMVVILHRDTATSSVGITLAGGADYETKEITVYKVLTGSPADKDGRIRKGDRILSINGKSMEGITHRESLSILKAPRSEVVLVISRCKSNTTVESIEQQPQSIDQASSDKNDVVNSRVFGPLTKVILSKDGSGLGFSLKGGKNSPTGDQPITVKKTFTGGKAEQCGKIFAGDELVSVNDIDVTGMSRTEAWNLMKRLVNGTVTLGIRHII